METVVLVVLAIVVALVALDAIARLDERGVKHDDLPRRGEGAISTQKINVDLTRRH